MNTLQTPVLPGWAQNLAVFDTETTGLVLQDARIVTACIAQIDSTGTLVGEAKEWIADPGIEIPKAASDVHGVTTEIARRDGSDPKLVIGEILKSLEELFAAGTPVVAYNAPYDFTILHFEALRHGLEPLTKIGPIIDPLVIDRKLDKWRSGSRKLEDTARLYSVKLDDAHNATADAVAAGRVAQAVAAKYVNDLSVTAEQLHDWQVAWSREQEESFAQYMRGKRSDFVAQFGWPVKLG